MYRNLNLPYKTISNIVELWIETGSLEATTKNIINWEHFIAWKTEGDDIMEKFENYVAMISVIDKNR